MENEQRWFNEATTRTLVHEVRNERFIIYKGFKITDNGIGTFILQDVRMSNMYGIVDSKTYSLMKEIGFIKAVDTIGYRRNKKRVVRYKKLMALQYDKRKKSQKELPNNRRLNEKRINSANTRIKEYADLIFLYQSRIQQFNFKYNNNE